MKQSYGITKSKALHQHWTNKHGTMVPKMQFKTLDDCLGYMNKHKINKNKFHPYVCPDCGMWHIGHSNHNQKNDL